jgi:hypothetical protein
LSRERTPRGDPMKAIEIQVKIMSLAAEAAIIRRLERKALSSARGARARKTNVLQKHEAQYLSLRWHRIGPVRDEARASLLTQAYLRGMPYKAVEHPNSTPIPMSRVVDLLAKYSPIENSAQDKPTDMTFADWMKGRKSRIEARILAWMEAQPSG